MANEKQQDKPVEPDHQDYRHCTDCGEYWPVSSDRECPFCGSDDTIIALTPDQDEREHNMYLLTEAETAINALQAENARLRAELNTALAELEAQDTEIESLQCVVDLFKVERGDLPDDRVPLRSDSSPCGPNQGDAANE